MGEEIAADDVPSGVNPVSRNAAAKLRVDDVLLIRRANEACGIWRRFLKCRRERYRRHVRRYGAELVREMRKGPRRYISAEGGGFCRGWPVSCHRRKLGLCEGDEEYETYEALARTPVVPPWARSESESDPEAFNKV